MNDLISRDELISDLAYVPPELLIDRNYLYARIMKLHTVDAAPVKHGQWIYFNFVGKGRYQCSECFHWVNAGIDRNYCPNCGAKMDGEV